MQYVQGIKESSICQEEVLVVRLQVLGGRDGCMIFKGGHSSVLNGVWSLLDGLFVGVVYFCLRVNVH